MVTDKEKFNIVIEYIKTDPENNLSGNFGKAISKPYTANGIDNIIQKLEQKFLNGRVIKRPELPKTMPDEVVSIVVEEYFGAKKSDIDRIKVEHQISMAAENIVGELLERYLAEKLEPFGWVWCSGSFVKAVDFLKKTETGWIALQVKNRSNTENSSSNKIREGTTIKKWYRIDAYTNVTFWKDFPDGKVANQVSEDDFKTFVKNYIKNIKE
jgi:hypothetical protein